MKEAARITDPVTHGDGLTTGELANGSPNVTIGGKRAARQGVDYASTCDGSPLKHLPKLNVKIAEGSRNVTLNSHRAARVGDQLTCDAKIKAGCTNVVIGGAKVSTTAGKPEEWLATFNKEAQGRTSGSVQQSYENCGLESSRALMLAAGKNVTEDQVLNYAVANNLADHSEANPAQWGGTGPDQRQAVLSHFGVASHEEAATQENITKAVADGKGVITSHDAGMLWNNNPDGQGHAVTVTGTESDADGHVTTVITNDTGLGEGERPVPAQQFFDSLRPGRPANISDGPLK